VLDYSAETRCGLHKKIVWVQQNSIPLWNIECAVLHNSKRTICKDVMGPPLFLVIWSDIQERIIKRDSKRVKRVIRSELLVITVNLVSLGYEKLGTYFE